VLVARARSSAFAGRRVGEAPSRYQRRLRATPAGVEGCFGLMGLLPADAFAGERNFREAGAR